MKTNKKNKKRHKKHKKETKNTKNDTKNMMNHTKNTMNETFLHLKYNSKMPKTASFMKTSPNRQKR